jgi:hypothetical protein
MESIIALTREQFVQNLEEGTEAVRRKIVRFSWNDLPIKEPYFNLLHSPFDGTRLRVPMIRRDARIISMAF